MSRGQQDRALFKGVVPGGETILDWVDTVSGRKRDMARADEEGTRGEARAHHRVEQFQHQHEYRTALDTAQSRREVMARSAPVLMPNIDRSTAAGQKEYELASRLLPVQEKLSEAKREAEIAGQGVLKAQERENTLAARGVELKQEADDIRQRIGPPPENPNINNGIYSTLRANGRSKIVAGFASAGAGAVETAFSIFGYGEDYRNTLRKKGHLGTAESAEGAERQRLLHEAGAKGVEQNGNLKLQEEAITGTRQAKDQKAQKDAGLKRAETAHSRVMSDWYGQQADTAANSAVRLATMDPGQRQTAMWALKEIQNNPSLVRDDPSLAQMASGIAPQVVNKILEREGHQTKEYQEGVAMGLVDMPGNAEDLRTKQTEEANKARKGEHAANQDLTVEIEKSIVESFTKLGETLTTKLSAVINNIEQKLLMSRSPA